jgi:hypothetical protein
MWDSQSTFLLGAQDLEMREIQRVLAATGMKYLHASHDGIRCSARSAYGANGAVLTGRGQMSRAAVVLPHAALIMVECHLLGHVPVARVDHHYPGDAGYDRPPREYLAGSSLGQVLMLLEMEPDSTQRLLAAGDHCLSAAYQGQCPGVDPHELLFLRAAWRASMSGRSLCDVMSGVLDAASRLKQHFDSDVAESVFLDPVEVPLDLAEGAAYAGTPIRYRELLPSGEMKEMLKGAAPENIERFMQGHADAGRSVYGNPFRGYAGAYLG